MKPFHNPLYHLEPNFTERANCVIKTMIASYVDKNHKNWDKFLAQLACAYRTSKQEVTQNTPYFLNFGCYMISENDFKIEKARDIFSEESVSHNSTPVTIKSDKLTEMRNFVRERLKLNHENTKGYYNLRHRSQQFEENDFVWVDVTSFLPLLKTSMQNLMRSMRVHIRFEKG